MGSICSPDNIDPKAIEPNITPRGRTKNPENGFINDKSTSYTNDQNDIDTDISTSQSQTHTNSKSNNDGLNIDLLDDIDTEDHELEPKINKTESLSYPIIDNIHSNTSRSGLKQIHKDLGIDDTYSNKNIKKKGFQIVVTPASEDNNIENENNNVNDNTNENIDSYEQKIDSTLGGQINWTKVGDFSALLPRKMKLKLWNGIFKTESDCNQSEIKIISKILKTFVMLHLTKEYRKTNESVPSEIKLQLPGAVKEPSEFISSFLKKDEHFLDQTLLNIYQTLCAKFKTTHETKRAKYAKKAKMTQDNYAELTRYDLKTDFNEEDFLKTAFLQYMLYAFQIQLDTQIRKQYSE